MNLITNLINEAKNYKPDIIFNALHGQYGEDGYIQSILENIGIPYTHSGVLPQQKLWIKKYQKKYLFKIKY